MASFRMCLVFCFWRKQCRGSRVEGRKLKIESRDGLLTNVQLNQKLPGMKKAVFEQYSSNTAEDL